MIFLEDVVVLFRKIITNVDEVNLIMFHSISNPVQKTTENKC